jgi:tRNA dimethylallyltransferase
MDIGTAKPTPAERALVPHHLIDIARPDETWSLAIYLQAAENAIAHIQARQRLPLLVGGSGQYIRAILEGWQVPVVAPDAPLRHALETWAESITPLGLHQRLAILDPKAALQIDYQNVRRTIRALEVIFSTGKPFSTQKNRQPSPYHCLILGLTRPRPELYARIDTRIEAMFQAGFTEEVKRLLEMGYSHELPNLSAIGYREVCAFILGKITLEEAKTQMKRQTRVFVRRQANWFKPDDPNIQWFTAGPNTLELMVEIVKNWLEKKEDPDRQLREA